MERNKFYLDNKNLIDLWWEKAGQKNKRYYDSLYKGLQFYVQQPVLEIGGGAGTFLAYNKIEEATILDLGGETSLVNNNYKFIKTDITKKLQKFNMKFKTIFVMETLEHIKNPLYLMAQIYDLLDSHGRCYVSVPYTKLDVERKNQKNPFNCHVCRWKKKELIDQMKKVGFNVKIIQIRRRFKNTAFWLPHCWIVLELKKRLTH